MGSLLYAQPQRGGMSHLEYLALARVHVHSAGQAWVEATHGAHDVDTLEAVGAVLLEDRLPRHRVLVRAGGAIRVGRRPVPRGGRVGAAVGDLAVPDHHVVRENPAHRLVEAAANG